MTDPTGVRVDVWWADLRSADVALAERLPPVERARALEPGRPGDRGRRLVAAALLQEAVAAARGLDGGQVLGRGEDQVVGPFEIDRTCEECGKQHGRPVVAGGPHLSVAHAGLLVVVATCWDAPVGVDVERVDRFGDDGGAQEALAWTAREALVKAGGGPDRRTLRIEPPLSGYVATVAVLSAAGVALTARRVEANGA
ncbi:4'-phosphopantetheinyl transferase family protein [Ornithinimicrobium tianjinense]|uniref:4'-phosphopantetheinyl transferase n=1 Tax=Ornithinimicrobium tianjinense TaxID=1195761 RepID=A0A917BYZ3_9MICO|nr:hypothetical protein [Ornithinimicrobium tianjinense]GGF60223.1 hypothetical protein GCM10011366_30080 [Ornithinimicrobium tianjinense]